MTPRTEYLKPHREPMTPETSALAREVITAVMVGRGNESKRRIIAGVAAFARNPVELRELYDLVHSLEETVLRHARHHLICMFEKGEMQYSAYQALYMIRMSQAMKSPDARLDGARVARWIRHAKNRHQAAVFGDDLEHEHFAWAMVGLIDKDYPLDKFAASVEVIVRNLDQALMILPLAIAQHDATPQNLTALMNAAPSLREGLL